MAEIRATRFTAEGDNQSVAGRSVAIARIDDLILSGPSPFVQARLAFDVHGLVETLLFKRLDDPWGDSNAEAGRETEVFASLRGPAFQSDAHLVFLNSSGGTFFTPFREAPTGVPLTVEFKISTRALASIHMRSVVAPAGAPYESAFIDFNFSNAVSFPTSGPVIDFEDASGFTANSLEANVVDNQWLDAPGASAVPEPSLLTLFGIGAVALFGYGWQRKRQTLAK